MPGPGAPTRGRSNIRSKHLVYIQTTDVFRYIGSHPYT